MNQEHTPRRRGKKAVVITEEERLRLTGAYLHLELIKTRAERDILRAQQEFQQKLEEVAAAYGQRDRHLDLETGTFREPQGQE